jgi:fumarate reductase subunit D
MLEINHHVVAVGRLVLLKLLMIVTALPLATQRHSCLQKIRFHVVMEYTVTFLLAVMVASLVGLGTGF